MPWDPDAKIVADFIAWYRVADFNGHLTVDPRALAMRFPGPDGKPIDSGAAYQAAMRLMDRTRER